MFNGNKSSNPYLAGSMLIYQRVMWQDPKHSKSKKVWFNGLVQSTDAIFPGWSIQTNWGGPLASSQQPCGDDGFSGMFIIDSWPFSMAAIRKFRPHQLGPFL